MKVLDFHIDGSVQARIDALAERANDDLLSENENERAEYESLIDTADIVSILKLKARRRLNSE